MRHFEVRKILIAHSKKSKTIILPDVVVVVRVVFDEFSVGLAVGIGLSPVKGMDGVGVVVGVVALEVVVNEVFVARVIELPTVIK